MQCSQVFVHFQPVPNLLVLLLPLLLSFHVMFLSPFIWINGIFLSHLSKKESERPSWTKLERGFPISLLLNCLCVFLFQTRFWDVDTLSNAELKFWLVGDFSDQILHPFLPNNLISSLLQQGWCHSTGFTVSSFQVSCLQYTSGSLLRHPDLSWVHLSTAELYSTFLIGHKWFVWTWTG